MRATARAFGLERGSEQGEELPDHGYLLELADGYAGLGQTLRSMAQIQEAKAATLGEIHDCLDFFAAVRNRMAEGAGDAPQEV